MDYLNELTLDERLRLVALEADEAGLPGWVGQVAHEAADVLEELRWRLGASSPPEPNKDPAGGGG